MISFYLGIILPSNTVNQKYFHYTIFNAGIFIKIFQLKYVRKFLISVTESPEYTLSFMFLQKLFLLVQQASFRVQIHKLYHPLVGSRFLP